MTHVVDASTFDRLADELLSRLPVVSPEVRDVGVPLYSLFGGGSSGYLRATRRET